MNKSQLVSILRTFSRKEWRELGKWMQSPAHNQRQDVLVLYEYLKQEKHLTGDEFLAKEVVFKHIYTNEAFDDARMRQCIHFFNKALESFLIYSELSQDEIYTKTALSRVYRKKQLDKPFKKNMKQILQLQEKYPMRDAHFLRNEYLVQQEQYTFLSEQKKRTTVFNLQEASDALDVTFIADKLRQICLILSHQTVYQANYDIGFLDEVLNFVESKNLLAQPAIAIYYYVYKALTEKEDEQHFQNLKREITTNSHLFPTSEMRDFYLLAINYCIGRMNIGSDFYIREAFELYKLGFEKHILVENENISPWTFHNVALIGLRLREFDWVEQFVENFQEFLSLKFRKSFVNYILGRLHYDKGNYDKTMDYINEAEIDDILLNLNSKLLLSKIFYEQENYNVLESLLESMRTYLVRKKVMGYHKSNYKNIIRYIRKLLKVNPFNKQHIDKLKQEITTANPLTEKEWLIRQLDQVRP